MSRRPALCVLACLCACFWSPGCGTVSPAASEATGRGHLRQAQCPRPERVEGRGEKARPAAAGGSEAPSPADGESARSRPVTVREKARRGIVTIQVADRSLDDVLNYLSRIANVSLVAMDDTVRDERISLDLKDANWRVALGAVAERCGLSIDERRIADGVILISRAPKGAKPALPAKPIPPLPERPERGAAPGRVQVGVVDRRLRDVLDYFSRAGGHRIVAVDDSIKDIKVTLFARDLDWRVALDVIAEKYFLAVRESEKEERTLLVERR